ncbi:MAG: IS66 family transposase [Oscillospiraceae bacterium]|jgi:transposase|nr:IS66 family transposase [Oscillospiraceae bacterium]
MDNELYTTNLEQENAMLKEEVIFLKQKFKCLYNEYSIIENQYRTLVEMVKLGRKQRFGASSEKSIYDNIQTNVFDEEESIAEPEIIEPKITIVKEHIRKKQLMSDKLPPELPVEIVEHELPEAERVCPNCNNELHDIGQEVLREELKIIPAKTVIVKHIRHSYGCRVCENESENVTIIKAPVPHPVIKGGFASPESVAHTMVQKFVMGSPIYRQEQEFRRNGIMLSRQTMTNWFIKCAHDWLLPVYDMMRKHLLENDVLFIDETTLQVLREPGKRPQTNSYLWVYRTGVHANYPIIISEYQPSRGAVHLKKFLEGYTGYIQCDGYKVYHNLIEEIIIVGCWSHARRLYDMALKVLPEKERTDTDAFKGKRFCDKLFEIERRIATLKPNERYTKRLELAGPVLDEYYKWLRWFKDHDLIGKNLFGKAVNYSLEQWKYLKNYLLDGRLEISTNRVERTIKPFVMSRKNFLFAVSQSGARASAIVFSLLETAIENKLNPYDYLVYVFKRAPNMDFTLPDNIESLMPHNVAKYINTS